MFAPSSASPWPAWRATGRRLLSAYGALLLDERAPVGALILAATLLDSNVGLPGLLAGLSALLARRLLHLPAQAGEGDLLNAIYVGLVLGAFHAANLRLCGLAVLGGALIPLIASALGPRLYTARGLPLLGAPFLCTAWMLLPAAKALAIPWRGWADAFLYPAWLEAPWQGALSMVGALYYVANPLSGLLLLCALLIASRLMTLAALAGGALACGAVIAGGAAPGGTLALLAAFNGALTALFLSTQSAATLRGVLLGALAALFAAAFSAGMLWTLWPLGLPPLSAPFLLAVWLMRAALHAGNHPCWARFWLAVATQPEESLRQQTMARVRGVDPASLALRPPFAGRMAVSQGFDGAHTHRGAWRYALDFVRTENGLSYGGDGSRLEDFHCFDQPVLSPAWGFVIACRSDIPDNLPGEMNLRDNWGNHVLIGLASGESVLLAHLRQASVCVFPGQAVVPGQVLGRCGNSGRSLQPHLHLHVQQGAWLGAPTRPFHLAGYLDRDGQFVLDGEIREGASVERPVANPGLAQALGLPAGRVWTFACGEERWALAVHLGLYGESTLIADSGARLQACHDDLLFALHERSGPADLRLDAFALAFGLTPLCEKDAGWRDAAPANLLPLGGFDRLRVALRHPFGAHLESRYERRWHPGRRLWLQRGCHRLPALGAPILAESLAYLSEAEGPLGFSLAVHGVTVLSAGLAGYGNRGDHGVPAWSVAPDTSVSSLQWHPGGP